MAGSIHALEDSDEFWSSIDLALVDIVASDEEGGLGVVRIQNIKNVVGVRLLWAVIVGKCDRAGS